MLQDIQKENGEKTINFNIQKEAIDLLSKMNSKKVNSIPIQIPPLNTFQDSCINNCWASAYREVIPSQQIYQ